MKSTSMLPEDRSPLGRSGSQHGIQSVEVAGPLLRALANASGPLPLSVVAKAADMAPAKAHRYLVSLIRVGLVEQNSGTGEYDLGPLALELGLASLGRLDALKLAEEVMASLRDATSETVALATWGNLGPTYVRLMQSRRPVTINFADRQRDADDLHCQRLMLCGILA